MSQSITAPTEFPTEASSEALTGHHLDTLFRPFEHKGLHLQNRIVMAPMTRSFSPNGIPGQNVADYYRRRAEGNVGLIITEGTLIPHPTAGSDPNVPHFYGEESLAGWKNVVEAVHAAGGRIAPQLWHVGLQRKIGDSPYPDVLPVGPSGLARPGEKVVEPMTQAEIDAIVQAYGKAAADAQRLGFDALEIHGAHGYLIDQFFWAGTNERTDQYGGDYIARTRFAVEVIREIRRQVGPDFPVIFRFSQWKGQDYEAKLTQTPEELEKFLQPLSEAGVDIFHASTRRFWVPEFEGSDLNLAGWTKKLTGKPAISVGSVTLDEEFIKTFQGATAEATGINQLLDRLERDEFDLIAIGRSLLSNPDWPDIVRAGDLGQLRPFSPEVVKTLY